ncbi:MAG: hypothetical protein Aurels2KO_44670 [Aureliella sp.]
MPDDAEKFHLIVLAGQSNMAGRGKVHSQDRKIHPRLLCLSSSGEWKHAVAPLHFDKPKLVGVGLGRTFALRYAAEHPGVTVGLIPCAVGGSPLSTWTPGGVHAQTNSHPYDDAIARCKTAMKNGRIKVVLWHQGESDSKPKLAPLYYQNLKQLITRFRSATDSGDAPWIIGQLGQFDSKPWSDGRRQVDRAHKVATTTTNRVAFVSSTGLVHKGDQAHFSSASVREFGRRYFDAWKQLQSCEPRLTLSPSEEDPRNSEGDFITLAGGRILFVYTKFTGGASDHAASDLVSRFSDDGGNTWSTTDELVLTNEGEMNTMSVSLLRLADGRIAMFYMRKNSLADCRPYLRFSTDEAATWGKPIEIIPDSAQGYYVLNNDRVVQLKSGRIVVPVALHNTPHQDSPDWAGQITTYLSDNTGETWRRSQTIQSLSDRETGRRIMLQEPGVVELDGGRLLCWVRTDAGFQYQSYSDDSGTSWSEFEPSSLASPRSPASIERIPATGDLLAVWNDHRFVDQDKRKARTPLSYSISSDEGKTWTDSIPLESDSDGWYCYTAIEFTQDAVLLGYCAGHQVPGMQLATTVVQRLPLDLLYRRAMQGRVVTHRRIWSGSAHNAFTDLCKFNDAWFCVFREGSKHVSPDGSLRVLKSTNLLDWHSVAEITSELGDLRDAKLTVTPRGQLMLSGAAALMPGASVRHQSLCWLSDDGANWSDAHPIGQPNYWLWRTTWNRETAYSVGYSTGQAPEGGHRHIRLFKSSDGKQFDVLSPAIFSGGYPNETSVLFDDADLAHCLLRRDGDESTALLGRAEPPYTDWDWLDTGMRFGGPHMIALPDGRVFAAGRLYTTKTTDGRTAPDVRTSLCRLNLETGRLTEIIHLPSGGDTSYPGLVWHNDHLWISYYSSHESGEIESNPDCHSSIYIAKIKLP